MAWLDPIRQGFGKFLARFTKTSKRSEAEKARLTRILEATSDFVSTATPDGRITYLNEAGRRIVGWLDDETVRAHKIADAHPDWAYRLIVDVGVPMALQTGTWTGETVVRGPDGAEIPVSQVIMAHKSADGQIEYFSSIARDLRERKRAEEALQKSEEKFAKAFRSSPIAIAVTRLRDGRILDANEAMLKLLHFTTDEVIGHTTRDLDIWVDVNDRAQFTQMLAAAGSVRDLEYRLRTKDGAIVTVYLSAEVLEFGGEPCMLSTLVDVTKRRQAEEALRESEERYRSLIDNSLVGVGISQGDRILLANQSLLRMYGYDDFGEFASRPLLDYLTPQSRALIQDWRQRRACGEDMPLILEHDIVRRDGAIRTLQLGLSYITIRDKRYVQATFIDITERKQAEKNLLAYQQELRSLTSELSLAEERERRRIAMGLHDHACQTLVLSKMRLQQLQESLPCGRWKEIADICATLDKTVESVREMIFDLSSPTLYKFGLEAALEELLEDKLKAQHGIQCTFRDDGAPKPLAEDVRILLYQSVRELLINAIKHARAQKVTLDIARRNGSIRITVADDGVGFNPDEVLATPSRRRGFGLFNITERLDYMGGALTMESQTGQGSRFTLIAPLAATDPAQETHDGDQDPAGG